MRFVPIKDRGSYFYDPGISVFEIIARERSRQAAAERRRLILSRFSAYIRRTVFLVAAIWCYASRCAIYGYISDIFTKLR
jgi:hypothetical protein